MTVSRKTRVARWAGVGLLALAPVPWLGLATASTANAAVFATVDGYEPFSSDANHPDFWGDDCTKIEGGNLGSSYVLTQDYAKVVVKAGSKNVDPYTNTIFNDAASGETVWADTNGDGIFNPGGKNGDKAISHIIFCQGEGQSTSPSPSPSKSSTSPSPSNTQSSQSASPSPSHTKTSASPSETESTGSASPSSSSAKPTETTKSPDKSKSPTEVQSSGSAAPAAAELPKTGGGMPISGALGASLLFIGIGILLLLGPGRLVPIGYNRKH